MLKFVLSLVVINLEATRHRRHSEADLSNGIGNRSADNYADAVVLACTPGTFDWTGATGAAAMPESLMSALVNFAASAYASGVWSTQQKKAKCNVFLTEGSDYSARVQESLEMVYRHIILPMNVFCADQAFKQTLNCAWDAFAKGSLGLWTQGMVGWNHLTDTARNNIDRKSEKTDRCAKIVVDIVTLYRDVFKEAWDKANQIQEQGYQSAAYKDILQPFLVNLIGKGGNVDKKPSLGTRVLDVFGVDTFTRYQMLSKVCDKLGWGYVEERSLNELKQRAKNSR